MMRYTVLALLVLCVTEDKCILIRSVQLHHARTNKTVLLLHDLHYAEPTIVTQHLCMIKKFAQQHPSATLIIEAPPHHDAPLITCITQALKTAYTGTRDTVQYSIIQETLGTLDTEPLLSQLGHTPFTNKTQLYDYRALLFALSDAMTMSTTINAMLPLTTQQLIATLKRLKTQLLHLKPIIPAMPASLQPNDYAACLAALHTYQKRLQTLPNNTPIFTLSDINTQDFFSWIIRSPTLCNTILEASFIESIQTDTSNLIIIITGATHAERIQMYCEQDEYRLIHDSGITWNGNHMRQPYRELLNAVIHRTTDLTSALHTIINTITPLHTIALADERDPDPSRC